MNKEQKALLEAIDIMIEEKLKHIHHNYYVDGIIKKVNSDNTYDVLINNNICKKVPSKNKLSYAVGDVVQVLIKNGDWGKKFIDDISNHNKPINIVANKIQVDNIDVTEIVSNKYMAKDKTNYIYPIICDNGTNIWLGAYERQSQHHTGKTYISAGYNTDNNNGNPTAYISVPNTANNNATNYGILHSGNFKDYDILSKDNLLDFAYPKNTIYITSTNTNPSTILGGTWELVDAEFKTEIKDITQGTNYTINSTNAKTSTMISMSRIGHNVYFRIKLVNNVAIGDTALTMFTLNFPTLGFSVVPWTQYVVVGASDGGNGVVYATMSYSNGVFETVDVNMKNDGVTSMAADNSIYFHMNITIPFEYMDLTYCDRFYWKRTA